MTGCNSTLRFARLAGAVSIAALAVAPGASAYDTAAATAAANGSSCTAARPFYWEIGGSSGAPIVSGQVGGTTYARTTTVDIGSASKWIFGAYVVERYNGIPGGSSGATIVSALNMLEGYTNFSPALCLITAKVSSCHTIGNNDTVDSSKVGDFNYGAGDGQYAAANSGLLNLGSKNKPGLLAELDAYLNLGASFTYNTPQVANGLTASPADFADFLQNIMDGTYEISNYMNYNPVDTVCSNCSSPMGSIDMHYSLYHWIEDHTGGTLPGGASLGTGDGTHSSAGAYGFYPWITSDLQYYGIVSREEAAGAYEDSLVCGKAIRDAFLN